MRLYRDGTLVDINEVKGPRKSVHKYPDGRAVAYCNYVDGMEVYELRPGAWMGWKLMRRFVGEKEVY